MLDGTLNRRSLPDVDRLADQLERRCDPTTLERAKRLARAAQSARRRADRAVRRSDVGYLESLVARALAASERAGS
ncbi:MAG: hypothetical protein ACRBI6_09185 [Acidimicrobiales bacterium]